MKFKWKNCDIECTVDEFEELYVRGIIDPSGIPHKSKEELGGPHIVPVYGCQIPMPDPRDIILTPGRPLGPGDTVELNLCKRVSEAAPDAMAEPATTEATADASQPELPADGGPDSNVTPAPIPSDAAGSSSASEDSGPGEHFPEHFPICYKTIKELGFDTDVFIDQFRDISNSALRDAALKLLDSHNYPTDYASCLIAKYLLHGTLEVGTKISDANSFAVNGKDGTICLYRKLPYRDSARLKIIPTKGEAHVELEILRTFNEADQSKFVFRSSDYTLPLAEFISVCAQTWPLISEDDYMNYVKKNTPSYW